MNRHGRTHSLQRILGALCLLLCCASLLTGTVQAQQNARTPPAGSGTKIIIQRPDKVSRNEIVIERPDGTSASVQSTGGQSTDAGSSTPQTGNSVTTGSSPPPRGGGGMYMDKQTGQIRDISTNKPLQGGTVGGRSVLLDPFVILIGGGGLCFVAWRFYSKLNDGKSERNVTGRMASLDEQAEMYGIGPAKGGYQLGFQMNPDGTRVDSSDNAGLLRLKPKERLAHTLIQAGSGAGKTSGAIIPQIIEDAQSGVFSLYVVDRKSPNIAAHTARIWERHGHRVILFDPWSPYTTFCFEPLWGASYQEILAIVEGHVIVDPDPNSTTTHYRMMERQVLENLFRCAQEFGRCKGRDEEDEEFFDCKCPYSAEDHVWNREGTYVKCDCLCRRHLCTLPAVARLVALGWETTKAAMEAARPDLVREMIDQWQLMPSKLSELFADIRAKMSLYLEEGPSAAFSRSDFKITDLVTPAEEGRRQSKRVMLIVGADQSRGDKATMLASVMTQLVAFAVYGRAATMEREGLTWENVIPIIMVLDEFGTYPIPRIDNFIATARSGGVGVLAALQAQDQLIKWYGRDSVAPMLTNFRTKIYLNGCESRVAKLLSDEIGKHLVPDKTRTKTSARMSSGFSRSEGRQERLVEEYVITPDSIVNMPLDRAIITGWTRATDVQMRQYFKHAPSNEMVVDAKDWYSFRCQRNARADLEGLERPSSEPVKPVPLRIDWTPIVGKEIMGMEAKTATSRKPAARASGGAAAGKDGGGDVKLTKKQEGIINAKFRALRMSEQAKAETFNIIKKPYDKLTKADGDKLIEYLREMENASAAKSEVAHRQTH